MKDCDWIYGIWFIADKRRHMDWLCQLFKRGGKWVVEYRWRYYSAESTDPFDNKDRKSWYGFSSQGDSLAERDVCVGGVNTILPAIEARMNAKCDFVLLECAPDDPKFFFELGSRPWAHMKRLPAEKPA